MDKYLLRVTEGLFLTFSGSITVLRNIDQLALLSLFDHAAVIPLLRIRNYENLYDILKPIWFLVLLETKSW